jgi:hypothetical protein
MQPERNRRGEPWRAQPSNLYAVDGPAPSRTGISEQGDLLSWAGPRDRRVRDER